MEYKHNPSNLDEGLRERIGQAQEAIEQGADVERVLQELVLGLQYDHALLRHDLTFIMRNYPNNSALTAQLKDIAEKHAVSAALQEDLDKFIDEHSRKSIFLMQGQGQDNAQFEVSDDFRIIRMSSRHLGCPQDPFTDYCKLRHEYGHFLSWWRGYRESQYEDALRVLEKNVRKNEPALTETQKWVILEEEIRAWQLARPKFTTQEVRDKYDQEASRVVNSYAKDFGISQETWENHSVPFGEMTQTWAGRPR